jgi:hypothetical protein
MSKTAINDLQALIRKLQVERQAHIDAIADIDVAFGTLGITPPKRRGRPRGVVMTTSKRTTRKNVGKAKVAKKTRGRKKFKMSGTASVLTLVARAGQKGVTGTEIMRNWKSQGRGDNCYKAIGMLVKTNKLKRIAIKGKKRGSIYATL